MEIIEKIAAHIKSGTDIRLQEELNIEMFKDCATGACVPVDRSWRLASILIQHIQGIVTKMHLDPEKPNFSVNQKESLAVCIDHICQHRIAPTLCDFINPQPILRRDLKTSARPNINPELNSRFLQENTEFILICLEHNQHIQLTTSVEYLLVLFLACLISLKHNSTEEIQSFVDSSLNRFEKLIIMEKYIKSLLLLKSFPGQPTASSQWLHERLLHCVQSPRGLQSLAMNLLAGSDDKIPLWSKCETVAKIVANPRHTRDFHHSIVSQLDQLYRLAVRENDERFIAVTVACFNQFLALNREEINQSIENIFTEKWRSLAQPEDILSGLCVLEEAEVRELIRLNFIAFRGSKVSGLKTKIILKIIPMLFQFAALLMENSEPRRQIESVVIHAMANREPGQLKTIIESILFNTSQTSSTEDKSHEYFTLHQRIGVKFNVVSQGYSVVIIPENEVTQLSDNALDFVKLLRRSNNNVLIFNVFMETLKIFDDVMSGDQQRMSGLELEFVTEQDAEYFIGRAFMKRSVVTATLAELITHKPFHFQFTENPTEILVFIRNLLRRKTENPLSTSDEQVLVLIFSIFREFITGQVEAYAKEVTEIKALARELRKSGQGMKDLQTQIDYFLDDWGDRTEAGGSNQQHRQLSKYELAKELCTNQEPYLRVYGTKEMMKLIRCRDTETMANLHAILLGALVYIKDEDSYSFLASIQLLVLLTKHLEGTVIETLVAEFQDDSMSMDYRLKIGEALVKTVAGLGVFAVKYKDLFINCFLKGVEDKSSSDEYRVSCIFNLGQMCKFLTYQVHNFFNELVMTLKMVLEQDAYLPSRRAAALLLAELLSGMTSLLDFQEFLLPVYRLLKHICNNDADEKTRIHATDGLLVLQEKIKEALTPAEKLEKEIKIMGIETEKDKEIRFPM